MNPSWFSSVGFVMQMFKLKTCTEIACCRLCNKAKTCLPKSLSWTYVYKMLAHPLFMITLLGRRSCKFASTTASNANIIATNANKMFGDRMRIHFINTCTLRLFWDYQYIQLWNFLKFRTDVTLRLTLETSVGSGGNKFYIYLLIVRK